MLARRKFETLLQDNKYDQVELAEEALRRFIVKLPGVGEADTLVLLGGLYTFLGLLMISYYSVFIMHDTGTCAHAHKHTNARRPSCNFARLLQFYRGEYRPTKNFN